MWCHDILQIDIQKNITPTLTNSSREIRQSDSLPSVVVPSVIMLSVIREKVMALTMVLCVQYMNICYIHILHNLDDFQTQAIWRAKTFIMVTFRRVTLDTKTRGQMALGLKTLSRMISAQRHSYVLNCCLAFGRVSFCLKLWRLGLANSQVGQSLRQPLNKNFKKFEIFILTKEQREADTFLLVKNILSCVIILKKIVKLVPQHSA